MSASADTAPVGEIFCPGCGYDLRAIDSDRCPECGLAVDRSAGGVSQVPWTHRRRIGRVRAYLATVRLATFHPRKLAEELNRPVSHADAQWFRAVTVAVASFGPLAVVFAIMADGDWMGRDTLANLDLPFWQPDAMLALDLGLPWLAGAQMYVVVPLAIVLMFALITGVASLWFAPRSLPPVQQHRAIALSYYASAPLALLPLVAVALAVSVSAGNLIRHDRHLRWNVEVGSGMAAVGIGMVIVLAMAAVTWKLLSAVMRASWPRVLLAELAILVSGVIAAALALVAFPWILGFVRLVFDSFL